MQRPYCSPSRVAGLAAALLLAPLLVSSRAQEVDSDATPPQTSPQVFLEIRGLHYDVGDPVRVRVTIRNDGGEVVDNPLPDPLIRGFQLTTADGKNLKPSGKIKATPALRPARLGPGAYFGQVIDVAPLFPALADKGKYTLSYKAGPIAADDVTLNIIPPYHEDSQYTATMETSLGNLTIQLFPDIAPVTVRNFVDLSRQGFYDGLTFHYVRRGNIIMGGDPRGDGTGGSGVTIPPEFNDKKHLTGSVGMVRKMDPASASSQFYICLSPQPERDGLFTLFGQVVEGLDTLKTMGEVPTTGQKTRPYYKPLEPLVIKTIKITEKEGPTAAS
ncbi:MAG: peptidylprolyl isomerase [Acidobacteriota bacterium]